MAETSEEARFTSRSTQSSPGGERPRERFVACGEECLSDVELLALILGCGAGGESSVDVARRLLAAAGGSLRRIGRLSLAELSALRGIGPSGATRLLASFALTRRFASEVVEAGASLRSADDVVDYFHAKLRDRKREELIALLLDGKNRVLREVTISCGSLTASIVHPREVFLPAIRESAGAILLVHNHPSGDPTPSREDLEVTRRLLRAGDLLGIPLLDHLVIGERGYTALVRDGGASLRRGERGRNASLPDQAGEGAESIGRRVE
jgi:DNA repair protein RadC